jgi:hypothetical protein
MVNHVPKIQNLQRSTTKTNFIEFDFKVPRRTKKLNSWNIQKTKNYPLTSINVRTHAHTRTRAHADTPTRRHADTPTRRHADTHTQTRKNLHMKNPEKYDK